MTTQLTSHVLMIRPVNFGFNHETAVNNHYQNSSNELNGKEVQQLALREFDGLVDKLRSSGISVTVIEDSNEPTTPDSIFPNNWVSFHEEGRTALYPMFAKNRRTERRPDILKTLNRSENHMFDMSGHESEYHFLEGTGSMVLDRKNKVVYACLSQRTNQKLLQEWAAEMEYSSCVFRATQNVDGTENPIYHTNVMMSVGEGLAVFCPEVIRKKTEREAVLNSLKKSGHEIVVITEKQVNQFAGNMLQLINSDGEKIMVMSTQAFESLTKDQITTIEERSTITHSELITIETLGGGSARCMLAEVF